MDARLGSLPTVARVAVVAASHAEPSQPPAILIRQARVPGSMARRNKGEEREVARERVLRLVALAEEATRAGLVERANRYADLAWRVKTTYQLRGSAIGARVCRSCHAFLHPGITSRVRIRAGRRSTTCLACGVVRRKVLAPKGLSQGQASPAP